MLAQKFLKDATDNITSQRNDQSKRTFSRIVQMFKAGKNQNSCNVDLVM